MAKAIRKQTAEVGERWERLTGHAGTWQEQVERALDKLQDLQSSMDQLDLHLAQAEELKAGWQPVGDLLIDSLQDHIERTTVSISLCLFTTVICNHGDESRPSSLIIRDDISKSSAKE